jgi:hypothetical protein
MDLLRPSRALQKEKCLLLWLQHGCEWWLSFMDYSALAAQNPRLEVTHVFVQGLSLQGGALQSGHWACRRLETVLNHALLHPGKQFLRVRLRGRRVARILRR